MFHNYKVPDKIHTKRVLMIEYGFCEQSESTEEKKVLQLTIMNYIICSLVCIFYVLFNSFVLLVGFSHNKLKYFKSRQSLIIDL